MTPGTNYIPTNTKLELLNIQQNSREEEKYKVGVVRRRRNGEGRSSKEEDESNYEGVAMRSRMSDMRWESRWE